MGDKQTDIYEEYYSSIQNINSDRNKKYYQYFISITNRKELAQFEIAQLNIDLEQYDKELQNIFRIIFSVIFEEKDNKIYSEDLKTLIFDVRDKLEILLIEIDDMNDDNNAKKLMFDFYLFWLGVIQIFDFIINIAQIYFEDIENMPNPEVIDDKMVKNFEKEFFYEWIQHADERFLFGFYKHFIDKFLNLVVPADLLETFVRATMIAINKVIYGIDYELRNIANSLKDYIVETYEVNVDIDNQFSIGYSKEKVSFLKTIGDVYDKIQLFGKGTKNELDISRDTFYFLFRLLREESLILNNASKKYYIESEFAYILHLLSGFSIKKLRTYNESDIQHEYATELLPKMERLVKKLKKLQ